MSRHDDAPTEQADLDSLRPVADGFALFLNSMTFEDRKLLREGREVELAGRIAERARIRLWRGLVLFGLYVGVGFWQLSRPRNLAAGQSWIDAASPWVGGFLVALGMLSLLGRCWMDAKARALKRLVEALPAAADRQPIARP
jgi:hypothetical protein